MIRLTKQAFWLISLVCLGEAAGAVVYLLSIDVQLMISPHQPANLIADRWMLAFFFTVVLYFVIVEILTISEKVGIIK